MNSLTKLPLKQITLLILILMITNFSLSYAQRVQGSNQYPIIKEADNAIKEAFAAVLQAEKAGADISGFITRLNQAGELLNKAEAAYNNGNLAEMISAADMSRAIARSVTDEVSDLKSSVVGNAAISFWHALIFSSFAVLGFFALLDFAWSMFKRVRSWRLLKMKPEVR